MTTITPTADPRTTNATGFAETSPREIDAWLRAGQAVLIDVREPDENARERIPGSHLVPLSRFDARTAAAFARPGQRLIFHCRSGKRSADAARMAAGASAPGVTIHSMSGGIEAWKKERLPVQADAGMSGLSIMRQVQLVVGTGALAGSALAWFVHPGFVAIPAFLGAGLAFAGATGTCALATVLGFMPWNRPSGAAPGAKGGCSGGSCSCG
jgi:rhodanese-related sulfurtransferase